MASERTTFQDGMLELQQQVAMAFAEELTKLRQENALLRKQVAEFPAVASELQDRVTLLEQSLAARAGHET